MNSTDSTIFLPFDHLLRVLRLHGFFFGVDTHVRLAAFWEEFSKNEAWTREDLKFQLAALLCRSGEQQEKFYDIFENYAPDLKPLEEVFELPLSEKKEEIKPVLPPVEAIKPVVQPSTAPVPPPIAPSQRTGPVYPLLAFPDNPLRFWNLVGMTETLIPLREKVWAETTEWDLPGTIRRSIRTGGTPEVVFKRRRQAPRYLALIEQKSLRDHLAGFCAELMREFSRRDLDAEFYFFDKTPARCWKVLRQPRTHVHLELLAGEYEGAKLLLMGNAACFTNALTNEPSNLARDIRGYWQDVALIATNSPLEWSAAERSLDELFPVLPLHLGGLNALPGAWSGVVRKALTDWQQQLVEPVPPALSLHSQRPADELLVELYRYLGANAFRWLCADAVYPEIYFELTTILHDEAVPPEVSLSDWEQNAVWHDALKLLSRLEWFRLGFLPEEMEERLRTLLPPADLGLVESEIRRILEWSNNAVPPGSHAEAERTELYGWLGGRTFRALWIDDHIENVVSIIADLQREFGIVFRTALSLEEAKTYLHEPFDLILSDLGRKEEPDTGSFTLRALRELSIPASVIFFTNTRGLNLRGTLVEQGAHEVTNSTPKLKELVRALILKKFPPPEPPVQQASRGDIEDGEPEGGTGTPDEAEATTADEYAPPYQQSYQQQTAANEPPETAPPLFDYGQVNVQLTLKKLGFYEGELDGKEGPQMKAAIVAFQKSKGLTPDGIAGPKTLDALAKAQQAHDNQTANAPSGLWQQLAKAVCQITLPSGTRGCGFLTEKGYIYTAGFLIPNTDALNRANAIFADPEGLAAYTFELDEQNFFKSDEGNEGFARVRIKDWNAEKTALFGQLVISASGPNTDSRVSLIYFGTGTEARHEFSLDNPLRGYSDREMTYEAETDMGASGAPVFDAEGRVMGVHLGKQGEQGLKRGVRVFAVPANQETAPEAALEQMKNELRELISKNETEEVFNRLQRIYPNSNDLTLLQAQWAELNKQERLAIRSYEEISIERNKARQIALSLIDKLDRVQPMSNSESPKKMEIRAMIAAGNLDEAFEALNSQMLENEELSILFRDWNQLKTQVINNTLSSYQLGVKRAGLITLLLTWLDKAELNEPAQKNKESA